MYHSVPGSIYIYITTTVVHAVPDDIVPGSDILPGSVILYRTREECGVSRCGVECCLCKNGKINLTAGITIDNPINIITFITERNVPTYNFINLNL